MTTEARAYAARTVPRVEATEFVSRAAHLDEQTEALLSAPDAAEGPSPEEAEAYLRDFAQTWRKANTYGLGSEQADMLHAHSMAKVTEPSYKDLQDEYLRRATHRLALAGEKRAKATIVLTIVLAAATVANILLVWVANLLPW